MCVLQVISARLANIYYVHVLNLNLTFTWKFILTFSTCLISQLLYTSVLLAVPPLKFPGSLIDRSQTYNSDDDTSVITQSVTSSKIPLNGTLRVSLSNTRKYFF